MGLFSFKKNKNNLTEAEARRERSNTWIKKHKIVCYENLSTIEESSEVTLKSLDDICRRAICSLMCIQIACDINSGNDFLKSKYFFQDLLKKYEIYEKDMTQKEKRVFDGTYSEQDLMDMDWDYEAFWSVVWALGFLDDIKDAATTCDCEKAIRIVIQSKDFYDFKSRCKLRDKNEILDMLDLYFRLHWACVENGINPSKSIGNIIPDVVWERRKGLEWLFSKENDWDNISLDT